MNIKKLIQILRSKIYFFKFNLIRYFRNVLEKTAIKQWNNYPLGKKIHSDKNTYIQLAESIKNDHYPEIDEYEKIERDSRPVMITSLNRKAYDSDSSKEVQEIDVIKDNRQENPVFELQRRDLQLLLTKGLTRAERLIVVLF